MDSSGTPEVANPGMAGTLEAVSRNLLSDPVWTKVFRNTCDAVEEQLNKLLISVATIGLGVRFVSSIASGDLLCIVNSINNTQAAQDEGYRFDKLSGPAHASLAAFASHDPACHSKVFDVKSHDDANMYLNLTGFMKYGPVFLILQAISLILIEKVSP